MNNLSQLVQIPASLQPRRRDSMRIGVATIIVGTCLFGCGAREGQIGASSAEEQPVAAAAPVAKEPVTGTAVGQPVAILVSKEQMGEIDALPKDVVCLTSASNPIKSLEGLADDEFASWVTSPEIPRKLMAAFGRKDTAVGLHIMGTGHEEADFTKNTKLRLFITHDRHADDLLKRGGVRIAFQIVKSDPAVPTQVPAETKSEQKKRRSGAKSHHTLSDKRPLWSVRLLSVDPIGEEIDYTLTKIRVKEQGHVFWRISLEMSCSFPKGDRLELTFMRQGWFQFSYTTGKNESHIAQIAGFDHPSTMVHPYCGVPSDKEKVSLIVVAPKDLVSGRGFELQFLDYYPPLRVDPVKELDTKRANATSD